MAKKKKTNGAALRGAGQAGDVIDYRHKGVTRLNIPPAGLAAWFLDSDYDRRCFCVCQAFFPDKTAWEKLGKALGGALDENAFARLSGTVSLPFPEGEHKRIAVKVIDPRGNEVLRVHKLGGEYE